MNRRLRARLADEFYARHHKLSDQLGNKFYSLYGSQGQLYNLFNSMRDQLQDPYRKLRRELSK